MRKALDMLGVKNAETAETVARGADGVVVGSALVEAVRMSLQDGKATAKTVPAVTALVGELIEGIRRVKKS